MIHECSIDETGMVSHATETSFITMKLADHSDAEKETKRTL